MMQVKVYDGTYLLMCLCSVADPEETDEGIIAKAVADYVRNKRIMMTNVDVIAINEDGPDGN